MSQPTVAELRKAVKLFNRWQFQEAHDAFRQLADGAEGRERTFLEDLFGNIGQVGAAGTGGAGGPNGS